MRPEHEPIWPGFAAWAGCWVLCGLIWLVICLLF
jgi:hypothetical protein